jgi:hypothetical protein
MRAIYIIDNINDGGVKKKIGVEGFEPPTT